MEEEKKTAAAEEAAPKKEKKADHAPDAKAADQKKAKAEAAAAIKRAEAAEAKAAEAEDKYMRLAAEYDNFRKRSAKERDGIYADATADALTNLLPLLDNLGRASAYTDGEKVAEGVKMILGTVPAVLEKLHVETFGAPGDTFDPTLHNAVFHIDDDAYGENEIVEVLQTGYRLGDKIIRYAMVKVAN